MTAIAGGFPARPGADRNIFLALIALVWVGVLSGFGVDSVRHVSAHGLDYPWIVHVHALVFVSWLLLFTAQVGFIRGGRPDLHRRLGAAGVALAAIMVVLGPATALIVDGTAYARTGETPEFLAVQLTDILGFAVLTGAGLAFRNQAAAHKRLMILGLLSISDAGFARFLSGFAAAPLGEGALAEVAGLYAGGTLLLVILGVYDLVSRGRLHPAYVAGGAFLLLLHAAAYTLLHSPAWLAVSLRAIGA